MAKPNYAYAKRQRDIAKKQKKEEKRLQKAEAQNLPVEVEASPTAPSLPTVDEG